MRKFENKCVILSAQSNKMLLHLIEQLGIMGHASLLAILDIAEVPYHLSEQYRSLLSSTPKHIFSFWPCLNHS